VLSANKKSTRSAFFGTLGQCIHQLLICFLFCSHRLSLSSIPIIHAPGIPTEPLVCFNKSITLEILKHLTISPNVACYQKASLITLKCVYLVVVTSAETATELLLVLSRLAAARKGTNTTRYLSCHCCYYRYKQLSFIHSFILNIYIAPLQENYSEALQTPARLKRAVLR